jgi:hypothetical protein
MTYNYDSIALCRKRKDQLLGFWSFILLNSIILGCSVLTSSEVAYFWEEPTRAIFGLPIFAGVYVFGSILPWIINGFVILFSLGNRPQFVVGYLASFAGLIVLSMLYVASCMVTYGVTDGGSFLVFLCPALVFPAWFILAGYQTRKLYRNACGDKPLFNMPGYRLEDSNATKPDKDEIRQRAEREREERESRENDNRDRPFL